VRTRVIIKDENKLVETGNSITRYRWDGAPGWVCDGGDDGRRSRVGGRPGQWENSEIIVTYYVIADVRLFYVFIP